MKCVTAKYFILSFNFNSYSPLGLWLHIIHYNQESGWQRIKPLIHRKHVSRWLCRTQDVWLIQQVQRNLPPLSALWIIIQFIIQIKILLRMKTVVIIIPDNSCKIDCAGQTGHLVSLIIQKIKIKRRRRKERNRTKIQKQHDMCKISCVILHMTWVRLFHVNND